MKYSYQGCSLSIMQNILSASIALIEKASNSDVCFYQKLFRKGNSRGNYSNLVKGCRHYSTDMHGSTI